MPELPEVETIRRDLQETILNRPIAQVEILLKKICKNPLSVFEKNLKNKSFKNILRRGKLLIFELNSCSNFLTVHLRMTGQLIFKNKNNFIVGGHSEPQLKKDFPNSYTHFILTFKDQSQLFFNDLRQFGFLQIVSPEDLEKILAKFGVEPFSDDFTYKNFEKIILSKKEKNIKSFLLDQSFIAGIGNIYADEILFAAELSPHNKVKDLTDLQIKKIFKFIKIILEKAIKSRGTTFNNFVDTKGRTGNFLKFLQVYSRGGQACLRCGQLLRKEKMRGGGLFGVWGVRGERCY